jgi:hypothetical protein
VLLVRWACNASFHEYGIIVEGTNETPFLWKGATATGEDETKDKIAGNRLFGLDGHPANQPYLQPRRALLYHGMPLPGATQAKSRLALLMIRALCQDLCHHFDFLAAS